MATTTTTTVPTTKTIAEGSALLTGIGSDVFYNNVQVPNRDLSVLVLNVFGEQWSQERNSPVLTPTTNFWGKTNSNHEVASSSTPTTTTTTNNVCPSEYCILEALSATGLRSIRYGKEVLHPKGIAKRVVCNDIEFAAVESIKRHAKSNEPYPNDMTLEASHCDAVELMMLSPARKFQVIDLDPYGAPTVFLDSAMQCIDHGGLLCVTATDTSVLCGATLDKCFAKYGAQPSHKPYQQEMGIRILLANLEENAKRHGKFIVPLVSLRLDFYLRVFVRVYEGVRTRSCLSHVLQSRSTDSFKLIPVESSFQFNPSSVLGDNLSAGEMGGFNLTGPVWSLPMFNLSFVETLLQELSSGKHAQLKYTPRLEGILAAVREELPDQPLYYSLNALCNFFHCSSPPLEKFQAAVMNAGYTISKSHQEPNVIKTNAPNEVIWDIMRSWIAKHPISKKRLESQAKDSVMNQLLACPVKLQANFDPPRALRQQRQNNNKQASVNHAAAPKYFLQNPEKNWGPKPRAFGGAKKPQDKRFKQDDNTTNNN